MTWAGARIEAFEVVPFSLRFREPYVTARGRLEERQLALLRLRAEGAEGLGEAAPLALRGGTPLALIVEELDALWRPQLMGEQLSGDPEDHVRGVAEFSRQARDAVKMALFDLVGQAVRRAGLAAARRDRGGAGAMQRDPDRGRSRQRWRTTPAGGPRAASRPSS